MGSQLIRAAGRAVAVSALALSAASATAQVFEWNDSSGGLWNDATNWTPAGIPQTLAHTAVIDLAGSYGITLGAISPSVTLLELTNPAVTLGIDDSRFLGVNDLVNDGIITVNFNSGGSATYINFLAASGTLSGTGEIILNATAGNLGRAYLTYDSAANLLTHAATHTIRGAGNIHTQIDNAGTISADRSGETLQLLSTNKSNSGLFEAVSGGILQINGVTVTQSGAGEIVADAGIVQLLGSARVNAGSLNALNAGEIRIVAGNVATLGSQPTLSGPFNLLDGASLRAADNLVNNGVITVNSSSGGSATYIAFDAVTSTLSGSGEVVLNATANNLDRAYLTYDSAANVLTHASGHTIRGMGRIHTSIINQGLISADQAGQTLQLLSTDKSNSSTMRATNGAILSLSGMTVTQTGAGRIRALNNSTVDLSGNAGVSGGRLESTGTGVVQIAAGHTANISGSPIVSGLLRLRDGAVLRALGNVQNDASIVVNSDSGGTATHIDFNEPTQTWSGTGEIVLNASANVLDRAYLTYDSAINVLVNGPQHTIRGKGNVYTRVDNQGLISADAPAEMLQLFGQPKTNASMIEAVNGAILQISGITLTQSGPGQIIADASELRLAGGAEVIGGQIHAINAGTTTVVAGHSASLTGDPLISGSTNVNDGATLSVNGNLTNDGVITVNPGGGGTATRVQFNEPAQTLSGSGELVLNATANVLDRAYLWYDSAINVLVQDADHTIRGRGNVYTRLDNHGLVSADMTGETLQLLSQPKTNRAIMQAVNGAFLQIAGVTVTQDSGQILADASSVRLSGGAAISGGDLSSTNGGTIELLAGHSATLIDAPSVAGRLNVQDGSTLRINGDLINNATVVVNPASGGSATHIAFDAPSQTVSGSGQIILNATADVFDRAYLWYDSSINVLINAPGHTIAGEGNIYTNIVNQGTMSPGHALAATGEIGRLGIPGRPLQFTDTGELVIQVEGVAAGQYDQITGSAAVTCDGTVRLEHFGAFNSAPFGTRITIIQGGSITGEFDTLIADALPGSLYWKLDYSTNLVEAVVSCDADTTIDGILDFFDVQNFLAIFSAGDPDSDLNGDGNIDFFDVLFYLNQFSAGC